MIDEIEISGLDYHFADFITRIDRTPCDELWQAAALASHAAGRGHTCLDLAAAAGRRIAPCPSTMKGQQLPDARQWSDALKACDTIGAPGDYAPLILDRAGRLYLQRSWKQERIVAAGILSRSAAEDFDATLLESALDRYFPGNGDMLDPQREAARMALTHRFCVISGGPGTGKTATVARIMALLTGMIDDGPLEIALAAPTGKAAMRLRQSILGTLEQLDLPREVRQRMTNEVSTIHRLLGVRRGGNGFRHHRDNPLPCTVLILDEASMIDLPLMAHLMEALKDDARLILLGDRDQLASVEAGAVLADICDCADSVPAGSGPAVVQLTRSYRFDQASGIAAMSRLINAGDWRSALELLTSGKHEDLVWRPLPAGRAFEQAISSSAGSGYAACLHAGSPQQALEELDRFRILSPLRSGPYGVENINILCENALGLKEDGERGGHRIRPVMVTANNYELGLYNGDTGVLLEQDGRMRAWFSDQEHGLRQLSPLRLPVHETAFALTVHKSQGSEYDKVLLVLPDRMSDALSRELLYTAVTRARKRVEVWGTAEVFQQAVERRTERISGLSDRLSGLA